MKAISLMTLSGQSESVPAFNPLTDVTSGTLILWAESDALTFQDVAKTTPAAADNAAVKALGDQSGNGHDFLEATNNPILKTNIVGTMPGILFDGINDIMATASFTSGIGFGGYTLFLSVAVAEMGGAAAALFTRGTYDPAFYHDVGAGVVGYYSSGAGAYNANLNTDPHVLTFRQPNGGSDATRLYVDGVLDVANPNSEVANWAAAALTLFGNGAGSQPGSGYVFGVGLFSGALSDADREACETYLLGKISGFFLGNGSFTYASSIE